MNARWLGTEVIATPSRSEVLGNRGISTLNEDVELRREADVDAPAFVINGCSSSECPSFFERLMLSHVVDPAGLRDLEY